MNKIASAKYLHIENYIQKIKFVSHKQHFFVFLPLEMQKRLKQTKVYHTFCYFAWKETTHKPLKVASAKNLFSSVYVLVQLASKNVFILCDNWKTLLFMKVYRNSEIL